MSPGTGLAGGVALVVVRTPPPAKLRLLVTVRFPVVNVLNAMLGTNDKFTLLPETLVTSWLAVPVMFRVPPPDTLPVPESAVSPMVVLTGLVVILVMQIGRAHV